MLVFLALAHLCALLLLTVSATRRLFSGFLTRCAATFILTWVNLAYTALSLATVSQLNNVFLYLTVSTGLAAGFLYAVARIGRGVEPLELFDAADDESVGGMRRVVTVFLWATLLLAGLSTLLIDLRYYANNWDTLAYRFSRVFFYLAQGHLLHFVQGFDPRAVFYPFNATLGYIFPAIYGLDGHVFNLPSLFCWVFSGCGVFLMSRVLGASRFGSFVAAWLCLMAPIVLCVGASTNDEVLAAAPTVCGMVFLIRALRQWSRRCAVLGLVGLGLGFGVKLHWGFLLRLPSWPFLSPPFFSCVLRRI